MMLTRPEILRVFVGHDPREEVAYEVCVKSLRRHASGPLDVQPLKSETLRRMGLYRRAPLPGTWTDATDGRPFSTDFAFTRFLVPTLCQWRGLALFVDCDFLFTRDVFELFSLNLFSNRAVHVVKHDSYAVAQSIKMDGREQQSYSRKNWSSFMLFNCAHESHLHLTPEVVNLQRGGWLHGFGWLQDDEIGALPSEWNHLVGERPRAPKLPAAIHYTNGGPWFTGCEYVDYADEWRRELNT